MVNIKAITPGHARALLSLDRPDLQELLAERIVSEDLSVRATEEAVRLVQAQLTTVPNARPVDGVENRPPGLYDFEELLSEHLATRVQISVSGKERGKITLSFAGFEDLERLYKAIADGPEPSRD